MADESRLRILHVLRHGQFNVQELTSVLSLSQPTISHHLKILQSAGLIRSRKEKTWAYYSLRSRSEELPESAVAHGFLDSLGSVSGEERERFDRDKQIIDDLLSKKRDSARRFFDTVAPDWKDLRAEAQGADSHMEALIAQIPSEGVLLELGCGAGSLLERVLPRTGATLGVDYSQAMLDEARRSLNGSKVDLRLGYLEHLPIGDESVDVAVAYMVLHHIADPREALRDVARVLRPGGKFLAVDLVRHDDERMRERFADLWLGFEPEEVKGWLDECGFRGVMVDLLGESRGAFLLTCTKP